MGSAISGLYQEQRPEAAITSDVKEFLTHLAVEKKSCCIHTKSGV